MESNEQSSIGLSGREGSLSSSLPCIKNSAESTGSSNQPTLQNPSGSMNLLNFDNDLPRKRVIVDPHFQDEVMNWSNPPIKNVMVLIDSNDPNPSSLQIQGSAKTSKFEFVDNLPGSLQTFVESSTNPTKKHIRSLLDSANSMTASNKSNNKKPKQLNLQTPRRSLRLMNFIGDHLPRLNIPVGPCFQADVPEWIDPPKRETLYNEDSSWLGTRIWPMEGRSTESELVGKGRSDTCSCASPGSADCIKCHINEERLRLQFEWVLLS
uniref:ELM2 domain-containing protein n=1 Tax=Nelumbo nucifera TaxID=4432 RepID=A0A822Y807_NELNU|nr:TPA_asm: hypothetical protein HUJ06_029880 [Nelumbo nucifera]